MACRLCAAKNTLNRVMFIGSNIFVIKCDIHDIPMAISCGHKPAFSKEEKELIHQIFYRDLRLQGTIDWAMRPSRDHAYCHLR